VYKIGGLVRRTKQCVKLPARIDHEHDGRMVDRVVVTVDSRFFKKDAETAGQFADFRQLARDAEIIVTKVTDVVKEGQKLKVKVLEIGRDGKIRLSHKAVLDE